MISSALPHSKLELARFSILQKIVYGKKSGFETFLFTDCVTQKHNNQYFDFLGLGCGGDPCDQMQSKIGIVGCIISEPQVG